MVKIIILLFTCYGIPSINTQSIYISHSVLALYLNLLLSIGLFWQLLFCFLHWLQTGLIFKEDFKNLFILQFHDWRDLNTIYYIRTLYQYLQYLLILFCSLLLLILLLYSYLFALISTISLAFLATYLAYCVLTTFSRWA